MPSIQYAKYIKVHHCTVLELFSTGRFERFANRIFQVSTTAGRVRVPKILGANFEHWMRSICKQRIAFVSTNFLRFCRDQLLN